MKDLAKSTQALARDLKAAGFVERDTGMEIDGHPVILLVAPPGTANGAPDGKVKTRPQGH